MDSQPKTARFTIVRLEERIAPGAMSGFCHSGSDKGSGKGSKKSKKSHKGSKKSHKGSHKGPKGGNCPPAPCPPKPCGW